MLSSSFCGFLATVKAKCLESHRGLFNRAVNNLEVWVRQGGRRPVWGDKRKEFWKLAAWRGSLTWLCTLESTDQRVSRIQCETKRLSSGRSMKMGICASDLFFLLLVNRHEWLEILGR